MFFDINSCDIFISIVRHFVPIYFVSIIKFLVNFSVISPSLLRVTGRLYTFHIIVLLILNHFIILVKSKRLFLQIQLDSPLIFHFSVFNNIWRDLGGTCKHLMLMHFPSFKIREFEWLQNSVVEAGKYQRSLFNLH